jgi:hypothetical protein
MLYIVTAHRWGWLNDGMYHVWAGDDQAKAEEIASAEVIGRGDKYGCQVLRCVEAEEGMEFERVAYFPSGYGEKVPYYSPHIAMHEDLGRLVRDAVTRGSINIADPDNPIYSKSVSVEVPQWLVDQVTRRLALAATLDDARRSGEATES